MLTGARPFAGEEITDTIAFVITREPDWSQLRASAPPRLVDLTRRCLKKDPRQRLRDVGDARLELEAATAEPTAADLQDGSGQVRGRGATAAATWAVAGVLAGGLATGLAVRAFMAEDGSQRVARFAVTPDDTAGSALFNDIAITPDGGRIVYAVEQPGTLQLHVRALDQVSGRPIENSQGAAELIAMSPRGDRIAFFADVSLRVIPLGGGASTTLTRIRGNIAGATWLDEDTIVYAQTGSGRAGLLRVSASGGTPVSIASPDPQKNEREYRYPHVLPDGESVVFTILPVKGGIAAARIAVRSLRTGAQSDLLEGATDAIYVATGHLVFGRNGGLSAVRFDPDKLAVTGRPVPLVENVVTTGAGDAAYSVSLDGTLVYLPGRSDPPRRLIRVTPDGKQVVPIESDSLNGARYARLSPIDNRLAVTLGAAFGGDIWVYDLDGARQPIKLTFEGHDLLPIWSPDGKTIVFQSDRSGTRNLYPCRQMERSSSRNRFCRATSGMSRRIGSSTAVRSYIPSCTRIRSGTCGYCP